MNGFNHCGAYLEHLQAEHHRLNCALIEIHHQIVELNRTTQSQEVLAGVRQSLENLLRELRNHFAEEEEGGCLEEAAARCPSLAPRTKDLMDEHPQLAQEMEQLLAITKDRTTNPKALRRQFEAFAKGLRAHQCAENRLLQTALGADAADYDMEGNE